MASALNQAVKDYFMKFTEDFEGGPNLGKIDYMLLDNLGRVGTAYGIDLDMIASGRPLDPAVSRREGLKRALAMSWERRTGGAASDAEVTAEWDRVKALPVGMVPWWYGHSAKLRLTRAEMEKRVFKLLEGNYAALKGGAKEFQDFDLWPADAQLAVLGLSWNGAGYLTGNSQGTLQNPAGFRAACKQQDFKLAASLCDMVQAPTNGSIARRSAAQKNLLLNAATVVDEESFGYYKRPTLYYPMLLL